MKNNPCQGIIHKNLIHTSIPIEFSKCPIPPYIDQLNTITSNIRTHFSGHYCNHMIHKQSSYQGVHKRLEFQICFTNITKHLGSSCKISK